MLPAAAAAIFLPASPLIAFCRQLYAAITLTPFHAASCYATVVFRHFSFFATIFAADAFAMPAMLSSRAATSAVMLRFRHCRASHAIRRRLIFRFSSPEAAAYGLFSPPNNASPP